MNELHLLGPESDPAEIQLTLFLPTFRSSALSVSSVCAVRIGLRRRVFLELFLNNVYIICTILYVIFCGNVAFIDVQSGEMRKV